ncbi:MAG: hypothetical protein IKM32_01010 [Clostridia bacterium]|nr:hypothetical protein [Clostridia bacterium]
MKNLKTTRRVSLLIGLVMVFGVLLAACVDTSSVEDALDTSKMKTESSEYVEQSEIELSTPEGCTDAPVVSGAVNIKPTTVAVYGTCEENATIRVSGGKEDAETTAHGTYYIVEVEIWDRNTLLKVTAQVEGEEESLEREIVAQKDATADTLLDGNSVSVGLNSRLYFDKMLEDMSGTNLYTASQLNSIRDYVTSTVTSYYNDRAGGQDVELIYLLVPNVTTVEDGIVPEEVVGETNTTVYEQIVSTLNQTRATVIDLKPVFEAAMQDEEAIAKYGKLYRETDSALSDYGAYIAYRELMNKVAETFPNAAPRALEEFEWSSVQVKGGNLVGYRELDGEVITEEIIAAVPNFDLEFGKDSAGSSKISSLNKYVNAEEGDYNFFLTADNNDDINGIAERWLIDATDRTDITDLPSALVYRDYSSLSFSDILAERFSKCMLGKMNDLDINLSTAPQYANDGDAVVDYIIVILSEENMDSAFSLAIS